ncbi:sacsin N-terminal ATP-binding-like domain-containing protein [Candidatus Tokpelaia sp.]|uniref:sacsin N-terminal ATP-binding-like domain-containing protein n=1 Tax=Candidatus Tokpelaia sp. TaxID=2233777 RepID=UPI00123A507C|nr:DUF3883 domain-containing protein [Candidatus Tokpelaia sp.]KAA6406339.1 hypothetical protein DPQ22_00045 [Candidatus Tokpelaia sp.]
MPLLPFRLHAPFFFSLNKIITIPEKAAVNAASSDNFYCIFSQIKLPLLKDKSRYRISTFLQIQNMYLLGKIMFKKCSDFFESLCKENLEEFGKGTNHLKMLSEQLYSDDTHFLFEILQNAEDAGASEIAFVLRADVLDIYHNGRVFSESDVRAVTQFAQSTKDDLTKIGKFGLGFKSVHAITEAPEIHSDIFHFCIKKYIRPEEIEPKAVNEWTTLFSLPFKETKAEAIYKGLSERLQNFDTRCLLFLKNLEQISFYIGGNDKGRYTKQVTERPNGLLQISLTGKEQQSFIIFQKGTEQQKIDLAFACTDSDKGKTLEKAQDTKLFVWFPTIKETGLHFLLNGNFITTASRESIPENNEHNKALIELAAELLAEALPQIKAAGLCDLSFLQTLPIEAGNFPESSFFCPLFAKIKDILKKEDYLPTAKQSFTSAQRAVIARSGELINLYTPEGKIWLSTAITRDRTPALLNYLEKSLGIEIISPTDFARRIDESFLAIQTDDWFIQFYQFLRAQRDLWSVRTIYKGRGFHKEAGILTTKPIIRLSDNSLYLPEKAFLPIETLIAYPMVKKVLTENEEALKFLKDLGLREPDTVDYIIKTILPKYWQFPNVSDEEYKGDLQQILDVLNSKSLDASSKLKEQLSGLKLIKCEDGIFREAGEVYCSSNLLKAWFKYSSNINFADEALSEKDQIKLGTMTRPDIIPVADYRYRDLAVIAGMGDFFTQLDSENIVTLKDILLQFNSKYPCLFMNDEITLTPSDKNYKNLSKNLLSTAQWILGKDGQFYKPADIVKEDIAESIKEIARLPFEFKTNREKELEEEAAALGKKLVDAERYDKYEAWERQQAAAKQQQEADWIPEVEPTQAIFTENELAAIPERESNPRIAQSRIMDSRNVFSEEYSEPPQPSSKKAKAVGEWGEEAVKGFLITEEGYTEKEIKILNENGNIGTGRDIECWRNGKLEKIIEVKSTENLTDHAFKVSGHQWEVARKEGDLYWLYILFGAGSENPEIVCVQNPIKKWKDGELQADPVNFIIRR